VEGLNTEVEMADDRLTLVYDESARGVKQQLEALNNLRTRTGALISAATISTSFLGGQALSDHRGLRTEGVLAIAAFVAVAVCVVIVLFPKRRWYFEFSPNALLGAEYQTLNINALHARLARDNEDFFDRNEKKLRFLLGVFALGSVLLIVEIGAWLLRLR
jgi:hypothetical protein